MERNGLFRLFKEYSSEPEEYRRPSGFESDVHLPRIARPMALAIRFDQLIRDGVVKDQAELARLGHVSRARLTQIMNLLNLAPEIQEEILFLEPVKSGREKLTERSLRPIAASPSWSIQYRLCAKAKDLEV